MEKKNKRRGTTAESGTFAGKARSCARTCRAQAALGSKRAIFRAKLELKSRCFSALRVAAASVCLAARLRSARHYYAMLRLRELQSVSQRDKQAVTDFRDSGELTKQSSSYAKARALLSANAVQQNNSAKETLERARS